MSQDKRAPRTSSLDASERSTDETIDDPASLEQARQLAIAHSAALRSASDVPSASDKTLTPPCPTTWMKDVSHQAPSVSTMIDVAPVEPSAGLAVENGIGGRYDILQQLGEGGMGFVYKVCDTQLNEVVALKMLRPELIADESAVERFKREVKLARRVTHPNVARTYDLGQHEGKVYLTMEYVEGESLAHLLDRVGTLPLLQALSIGLAMADGLSAAHKAHVIHRDLKPANVLLARDGRVLLSDFGIAGVDIRGAAADATGSPLGTPAYMSPEQLQGRHDIDTRADLYALGLILYELFSGKRAWYEENPFSLIYHRLSGAKVEPLASLVPSLPPVLFALMDELLAWERDDRVQSADEIATCLQDVLQTLAESEGVPHQATRTANVRQFISDLNAEDARVPRWRPLVHRAATPTQIGEKRVAVLPFRAAEDDSFLAEGLSEDLCDLLTMLSGVRVRPMRLVRQSVSAHPNQGVDELAEILQVDVLIEGSIRRMGDRLLIPVRLLSADDGYQLWARRFQCSTGDIFSISEQIAAAVADALTLQTDLVERLTTTNPEAIELYFRARQEQRLHWHGDLSGAKVLYNRALAMVPDDPLVLVGAAVSHARGAFFQLGVSDEYLKEGKALAERAIAANPSRGEPYFALGLVSYYYVEETGKALDSICTALERLPDMPRANELLGRILIEIGPLEDGIACSRRALHLEPQLLNARWDLMRAHALLGEWDQVDLLGDLPVEESLPNDVRVRQIARTRVDFWRDTPRWSDIPMPLGHPDPLLAKGLELLEHIRVHKTLPDETRLLIQQLQSYDGNTRWQLVLYQTLAETLAFTSHHRLCLDTLQILLDKGFVDLMWLECCPLFVPLHAEPAFQQIRETLSQRVRAMKEPLLVRRED